MSQGEIQTSESPEKEAAPSPVRWRKWLSAIAVAIWCSLLFAFCLWLFTRNNGFPVGFHPDEGGKVHQIVRDVRNYRHPQLMLEATQLWKSWANIPDDTQSVVVAGRQVAAFFGAAAATMMALTAFLCARWWGLILGSILLGLCPYILTYSHYMKEDTSLLVGVAMTILASRVIWMTRRWYARIPAWALIAAGCALAASGKYVGIMTLALPLVLIIFAPGFRWYRPILRLLLFVPLLVLFLGIINHRTLNPDGLDITTVVRDPSQWQILFRPGFLRGLEEEVEHSGSSHWGLTANRPNTYFVRTAVEQCWPAVFIAALALPLAVLMTRKHGWGWETLFVLFAAFCTLVLSYSVILFPRYVLPITAMLHLMAAISLGRLLMATHARPVTQATLGVVAAVVMLATYAPVCADFTHQFSDDSRYALNYWAINNIPQNARVFADGYAELHDSALPFARQRRDVRLRTHFILGTMGDLQRQINAGEAYYVICDLSYSRYFEPVAIPAPGHEGSSRNAKRFYEYLLTTQTPVWSAKEKRNMRAFTSPEIHVYRMTPEMFKGLSEKAD